MPVALVCLQDHDIAHGNLTLFFLRCGNTLAGSDDQNLVAGMAMPSRRGAFTKVHHAAAVVGRLSLTDDGLACSADGCLRSTLGQVQLRP